VIKMLYKRIRELREDNDQQQKEIAKLLNTTQQHYSRIENGKTEIKAEDIVKLAIHYNVTADYILELSNKKTQL
jgi:transcriptional regulator with XRE-family HTH domain